MWLGQQITERGIGNGMSLIIFAGIVVGLPRAALATWTSCGPGRRPAAAHHAVRPDGRGDWRDRVRGARPPARHRAVCEACGRAPDGRRPEHAHSAEGEHRWRYPGHLRVVDLAFPATIAQMFGEDSLHAAGERQLAWGMPLYDLLYVTGIIFFCYFYTAIIFNPDDVAESIRKVRQVRTGIRRGERTTKVIDTIRTRIRWWRALPGRGGDPAGVPDQRLQGRTDPVHRRAPRRRAPRFITEGLNVQSSSAASRC